MDRARGEQRDTRGAAATAIRMIECRSDLSRLEQDVTAGSWRCPLCKELADDARQHLADAHGVGSGPDRFGLRDATRPAPGRGPRPLPSDEPADDPDLAEPAGP